MNSKTNKSNTDIFGSLQLKKRKKNDYRKLQEGAYPLIFKEQVLKAKSAVATGKLSDTRMARLDKRTGGYLLTMGFGKRNTHFENAYIAKGEVAECATAEEALKALDFILKAAQAGEFDKALNELCANRQAHAETMIEARDVCGFHRRHNALPQKLLPSPSLLLEATQVPARIE